MRKTAKRSLLAVTIAGICIVLAGCSSYKCDWCGKDFSGTTYFAGVSQSDMDDVVCRDCAQNYWAPLNVENFKRG